MDPYRYRPQQRLSFFDRLAIQHGASFEEGYSPSLRELLIERCVTFLILAIGLAPSAYWYRYPHQSLWEMFLHTALLAVWMAAYFGPLWKLHLSLLKRYKQLKNG